MTRLNILALQLKDSITVVGYINKKHPLYTWDDEKK